MQDPMRVHPRPLFLLVFAATLFAAACSSAPSVEVSGDETSEAAESGDDGSTPDDSASIESEEAAMGEDEAAGNDPDSPDQGSGGQDSSAEESADQASPDEDSSDQASSDADSPDGDSEGATSGSASTSADLAAALAVGQDIQFSLPFLYLTVDQSCDGCAETASLYYVPGPVTAGILALESAFVDGNEVPLTVVDPILREGDPRLVAERLAEAEAAGSLDSYSIDPVSGLVTNWVVDGDEVTLRCLQVDTRPIELRSELCRDSLIG